MSALPQDRFCPVCSDEVTPVSDIRRGGLVCPWCDTPLSGKPVATAPRPAPRHRLAPASGPLRHKHARIAGLEPAPPPDPIALLQGPERPQPTVADLRKGLPETFVREAMAAYLEAPTLTDASIALVERYPGRWANAASLRSGLIYAMRCRGVLVDADRRTVRHRPELIRIEHERIREYLRHPDPGMAYKGNLPPALLWEAAWRYYYDGYGFLRISRLLIARWPWTATNPARLGKRLHYAFHMNGWPTRAQPDATGAANYRHGMTIHHDKAAYNLHRKRQQNPPRPRCRGVTKAGRQCYRFAAVGDVFCYSHSEAAATRRSFDAMLSQEKRDGYLVDSGPFIVWLAARVRQYGTQKRAAEVLGLGESILGRLLKRGGTSQRGKVTRRLIERTLQAAIENDPELLVPRFSDLYDTTPVADSQPRLVA